jgi:hypothetical protein
MNLSIHKFSEACAVAMALYLVHRIRHHPAGAALVSKKLQLDAMGLVSAT